MVINLINVRDCMNIYFSKSIMQHDIIMVINLINDINYIYVNYYIDARI